MNTQHNYSDQVKSATKKILQDKPELNASHRTLDAVNELISGTYANYIAVRDDAINRLKEERAYRASNNNEERVLIIDTAINTLESIDYSRYNI